MWENDCGSLPVVDESGRPIAMITDRDICMCAYTRGLPLAALQVATAMSRTVVSCSAGVSFATAEKQMRQYRLYRLPVVSRNGRIVGVLSLNDAAREAEKERETNNVKRAVTDEEIAVTLGAICSRRTPVVTSTCAAAETADPLSTHSEPSRPTARRDASREKRITAKSQ
jgi:CBS domain-containing protein